MRQFHVYILSSRTRRIYVGVTSALERRAWQHAQRAMPGFTSRYGITRLVYIESFTDPHLAIAREKQLKKWPRWRKDRLIELANPGWCDLAAAWGWRDADTRGGA